MLRATCTTHFNSAQQWELTPAFMVASHTAC